MSKDPSKPEATLSGLPLQLAVSLKGSWSDYLLPELQELTAEGFRRSLGSGDLPAGTLPSAQLSIRQLIQRGPGSTSLPCTGEALSGVELSQHAQSTPMNGSAPLWHIPSLNLPERMMQQAMHMGLLQQGQVEAGQQLAAQSEAAHYANVIQASQMMGANPELLHRLLSANSQQLQLQQQQQQQYFLAQQQAQQQAVQGGGTPSLPLGPTPQTQDVSKPEGLPLAPSRRPSSGERSPKKAEEAQKQLESGVSSPKSNIANNILHYVGSSSQQATPKTAFEGAGESKPSHRADSGPSTSGISDKDFQKLGGKKRGQDGLEEQMTSDGSRARTLRQQEQNKQAQQRYRQRKKAKVVEMESQVTAMQQQMTELQRVMKHNVALQEKALALEERLAAKEAECEALQKQAAKAPQDEGMSKPAEVGDLQMECQDCVMNLQQLVDDHKLRTIDVSGAGLDRSVLESLSESIGKCLRVCQQAQAEGISPSDILTCDQQALNNFANPDPVARWRDVIKNMRLGDSQCKQLVKWHAGHVKQLQTLATARQPSAEMMRDMGQGNASGSAVANLESYTEVARNNLALLRKMHTIKEALQKEAKVVQQYSYVVMNRILTPVQAAVLLADAWPSFCDCFAFTKALSLQEERNGS